MKRLAVAVKSGHPVIGSRAAGMCSRRGRRARHSVRSMRVSDHPGEFIVAMDELMTENGVQTNFSQTWHRPSRDVSGAGRRRNTRPGRRRVV